MKRLIFVLILILVTILLTGCRKDSEDDFDTEFELPEYIYLTDIIQFPQFPTAYSNFGAVALSNDSVYFTVWGFCDEDTTIHANSLYMMNLDGTGFTELSNHSVNSIPPDALQGSAMITSLYIDSDGNVWTVESGNYAMSNSRDDQRSFYKVRKLDNTGKMLQEIDISSLTTGSDYFYISAFSVDMMENIYIAIDTNIYVLNTKGDLLFTLITQEYIWQLTNLSDGTVAHVSGQPGERLLNKIDTQNRRWGEIIRLPDDAGNVFPGNDDYEIYFNQGINLFGFSAETGEAEYILNWLESGIIAYEIIDLVISPEGRITTLLQSQRSTTGTQTFELAHLTKTPYTDLSERTTFTLGTLHAGRILSDAVIQFNRKSLTHRIHIIDYSMYNTSEDTQAGLTRFTTEIIAGRGPDIICLTSLPVTRFAARGMLVDLYPLLDADPVINREMMIGNLLSEDEIDSKLYRIIPGFTINTLIGSSSLLGNDPGWNMDEFTTLLDENPQADIPLGSSFTSEYFLRTFLSHNMHSYVDRESGTVSFDNNSFIELLELANTFPPDWFFSGYEHIMTGRQIMSSITFGRFDTFKWDRAVYGVRPVIKGFPVEDQSGHLLNPVESVAITTRCKDVEGAWEFIRLLLTDDFQRNHLIDYFPVNSAIFEERIEDAKREQGISYITGIAGYGSVNIRILPLTHFEAETILKILESIKIAPDDETLFNIINESASDFFNGKITSQDAARIIQSRAKIYISEQN